MFKPLGKGLTLLAFVAAALTSCKKDKDDNPNAITKENLVGSYTLVEVRDKIGDDDEFDATNDWMEECEQDDVITLNANMTYTYSDKGTVCEPKGDDSGMWTFDEDEKMLETDSEISGEIVSFTDTQLVVRYSFNQGGFSLVRHWTFARK